jgi:hypothetical protein
MSGSAGETEVVGENLPRRNLVHHKSHLPDPVANPGRRGGKPASNTIKYIYIWAHNSLFYLLEVKFLICE